MRYARVLTASLSALFIFLSSCGENDCPTKPQLGHEKIYGHVIGANGPIAGATIWIAPRGDTNPEQNVPLVAETDSTGRYEVVVLPGKFLVQIRVPEMSGDLWYATPRYVNRSRDADTLRIVSVGDSLQADFFLGGLEIRLRQPPELAAYRLTCILERAHSRVISSFAEVLSEPQEGDRVFTFDMLPTFDFNVKIEVSDPNTDEYTVFWLPPTLDRSTAYPLPVDPLVVVDYSFEVPEPAFLRGSVGGLWRELDLGNPEINIHGSRGSELGSRTVDDLGSFTLPVFAPGELVVSIYSRHYRWRVGGGAGGTTRVFNIVPGTDIYLDPIKVGGLRCRLVGDPAWEPYSLRIELYDDDGWFVVGFQANQTDTVVIPLFSTAPYKLEIQANSSSPWRPQWFDRALSKEEATPVFLPADGQIVSLDINLEEGGTIAGTIYDFSNEPAGDLHPYAESMGGGLGYSTTSDTDAGGEYLLEGLSNGNVIVGVRHNYMNYYVTTWYPGVSDKDSAQIITIVDANDISGIDFQLTVPPDLDIP